MRNKTYTLTTSALFVALTAVCSWISIPLPGSVPINLATFAVILAGGVLGYKYGPAAMAVFLILGAIGAPVFHSFTGGMGIVFGPTGGFLIGYIALAFIVGLSARSEKASAFAIAFVLGEAVLYALGCFWFIKMTGNPMSVALTACVLPFIPGDIVKGVLAYIVKKRIDKSGFGLYS